MDVEFTEFMQKKKKTTIGPCDQSDGIESMNDCQIQKDAWEVVHKTYVNRVLKNRMMYLEDKHC